MRSEALPRDVFEALEAAGSHLAGRIRYRSEVGSTNDEALRLAELGAADGTAVVADVQRAGRGRLGRSWHSPAGAGLYVSVIVRPCNWTGGLPLVTLGAGVAAARAVTGTSGLPVELKWPNDLVVDRPWRKLGGVLSEALGSGARADAVVIGIGINLQPAAYPPDIAERAASVEVELGRPVDRGLLLVAVLTELERVLARMRAEDAAWLLDEWRRLGGAGLRRAPVRWQEHGRWCTGTAVDLAPDGALVVETEGRRRDIVAGEVLWERVES